VLDWLPKRLQLVVLLCNLTRGVGKRVLLLLPLA